MLHYILAALFILIAQLLHQPTYCQTIQSTCLPDTPLNTSYYLWNNTGSDKYCTFQFNGSWSIQVNITSNRNRNKKYTFTIIEFMQTGETTTSTTSSSNSDKQINNWKLLSYVLIPTTIILLIAIIWMSVIVYYAYRRERQLQPDSINQQWAHFGPRKTSVTIKVASSSANAKNKMLAMEAVEQKRNMTRYVTEPTSDNIQNINKESKQTQNTKKEEAPQETYDIEDQETGKQTTKPKCSTSKETKSVHVEEVYGNDNNKDNDCMGEVYGTE